MRLREYILRDMELLLHERSAGQDQGTAGKLAGKEELQAVTGPDVGRGFSAESVGTATMESICVRFRTDRIHQLDDPALEFLTAHPSRCWHMSPPTQAFFAARSWRPETLSKSG